jgi:hypothetical protein
MPLPDDAILAELVERRTLNKPEAFVRQVLEYMHQCRREYGEPSVRIGVTGEGRAPNYRLEYPKEGMPHPIVVQVYSGLSHNRLKDLVNDTWVNPKWLRYWGWARTRRYRQHQNIRYRLNIGVAGQ